MPLKCGGCGVRREAEAPHFSTGQELGLAIVDLTTDVLKHWCVMQNVAPSLPANNVAEAMAWYRDVLGFSVIRFFEHEDYAIVKRDGVEIHLFHMEIDPKKSDFMVYVRVDEIEDLYAEYAAKNLIHPNSPLQLKPWGQTEFAILDPNGALVTFGQGSEDLPTLG